MVWLQLRLPQKSVVRPIVVPISARISTSIYRHGLAVQSLSNAVIAVTGANNEVGFALLTVQSSDEHARAGMGVRELAGTRVQSALTERAVLLVADGNVLLVADYPGSNGVSVSSFSCDKEQIWRATELISWREPRFTQIQRISLNRFGKAEVAYTTAGHAYLRRTGLVVVRTTTNRIESRFSMGLSIIGSKSRLDLVEFPDRGAPIATSYEVDADGGSIRGKQVRPPTTRATSCWISPSGALVVWQIPPSMPLRWLSNFLRTWPSIGFRFESTLVCADREGLVVCTLTNPSAMQARVFWAQDDSSFWVQTPSEVAIVPLVARLN